MNTDIKYAGFWSRVGATVLDSLWLYGIIYLILWFVVGPEHFGPDMKYTLTQFSLEWVLPFIVVMAFWIKKAATPGKMAFNMRLVDAKTHEPVSTQRLVLRYFAYFVSTLPLGLGFLWVAWDKKKQGWHDKIAGTVIVR